MDEWIGSSAGGDFATQGHVTLYRAVGRQMSVETTWWNRPFVVWVVSGTLVLIGLILRRTSWENRITLVLLALFGVALWTLRDGYAALQFATAAGPGMATVLLIWVLGLLLGQRDADANGGAGGAGSTGNGPPAAGGTARSGDVPANPAESRASTPAAAPPDPEPAAPAETEAPPGTVTPPPDADSQRDDSMGGKP